MEKLTVVCWKWRPRPTYRSQFTAEHVNIFRAMVARHYRRPHEVVCVTDDPKGIDADVRIVPIGELFNKHTQLVGPNGVNCYRRLEAYGHHMREIFGPRFVSGDLDVVMVDDMAPLWDVPEDFKIWGDTARNTPYNGSMWLMNAGARAQVWERFNPDSSPAQARAAGFIGSDQAIVALILGPGEAKWTTADGVYSWRVHVKPAGGELPGNARIVIFPGREDPWSPELQARYPWIARHYRA
jgi:hypothetical protein